MTSTDKRLFIEVAEERIREALRALKICGCGAITEEFMQSQLYIVAKVVVADMCEERAHADHPLFAGVRVGWEGTEIIVRTWAPGHSDRTVRIPVEEELQRDMEPVT